MYIRSMCMYIRYEYEYVTNILKSTTKRFSVWLVRYICMYIN